jgi:hypothetical protein
MRERSILKFMEKIIKAPPNERKISFEKIIELRNNENSP